LRTERPVPRNCSLKLGTGTFRFPKVHLAEIAKETLDTLGFRRADGHLLFATNARSE